MQQKQKLIQSPIDNSHNNNMERQDQIKIIGSDEVTESDVVTDVDESTDLNGKNGIVTGAILYGRTNGNIYPVLIDAKTHAIIAIDQLHHETHQGYKFICNNKEIGIIVNGTSSLAFKTPTGTKKIHLLIDWATYAGGDLKILEGATWTQGTGTAVNMMNSNRNLNYNSIILEDVNQPTFTASNQMIQNVTIVSRGTEWLLDSSFGFRNIISGDTRDEKEIILAPDTQYIIEFTSSSAGNSVFIGLSWYEHTDY